MNNMNNVEFEEMQSKYYARVKAEKDEELLDWFIKLQLGPNREVLEELAFNWSSALGYTFSGPIRSPETSPAMLSMLLPYTALPSAGKDLSQNTKGELFEIEAPGGRFTTKYTRKTILNATRACAYSELKDFAQFFFALRQTNTLELCLEPGFKLCKCGFPVQTESSSPEDKFCSHCGKTIKNFRLIESYNENTHTDEDDDVEDIFCDAILI